MPGYRSVRGRIAWGFVVSGRKNCPASMVSGSKNFPASVVNDRNKCLMSVVSKRKKFPMSVISEKKKCPVLTFWWSVRLWNTFYCFAALYMLGVFSLALHLVSFVSPLS